MAKRKTNYKVAKEKTTKEVPEVQVPEVKETIKI